MSTTVRMKASQIAKDWHVIDAAGRPLGRVASEAAILLRGKHKPTFEPHLDGGDFVIIVNASQVRLSGRKAEQIEYHRHSGYPGGLRTRSFAVEFARFPDRVVAQAVWGMLPKGPLGKAMARHLKIYAGPNHPHQSQVVGSEKAKAVREALLAETVTLPMKAPRLRPLSVPQVVEEAPVPAAVIEVPAAPLEKPAPRARARKPVEVRAAEAVEAVPVAEVPAAEAVPPETAVPKGSRRKAAEEPAPEARATAATPRARSKKSEAVETEPAAPRARATRKKTETAEAVASDAPAPEEKKPVRRRAAAKTEE